MPHHDVATLVVVIMGVSGSGKTTIGRRVAERLGWAFEEGDRLHPPENVQKMQSGHPLDDDDRAPWLASIADAIDRWREEGTHALIACSALRRRYREQIIGARPDVRLAYLEGSHELLAERIANRHGHFMPASLLDSQFATLEPPGADEDPITISVDAPIEDIVARLAEALVPGAR